MNKALVPPHFFRFSPFCARRVVFIALFVLSSPLPALMAREPRLLSQFYLVNDPASVQSLEQNYAKISLVCPQWFSVDESGNLKSTVDSAVVAWSAEKNVLLMPLVVNDKFQPAIAHAVLQNDALQSQLIQQLILSAEANHFFGIQFDLENIPGEDRDLYSRFIAQAEKEFRRHHLKLSVAVAPPLAPPPAVSPLAPAPTSGWISNPHATAYDYERLADGALFISLMTYDEFAVPEQPGPVAGAPWVEACLRETLKSVSRKKLLLGLPLYYRAWSGKSVREGSIQEAQDLATKANTTVSLDADQREAYFTYKDGGQLWTVWTQNVQSLHERLEMVNQYQLAGFSAWRLGFEDPNDWESAFPEAIKKIH